MAGLIALIGAIDDAIDLNPLLKLLGQIGAAIVAVRGGAVIENLAIPFAGSLQFPHEGGPLTVVWLVALMNIVNFSDGVDGLAAGVCTIDGVAFAIIAFNLQGGTSWAAVLAAITAGASLGFLFHNFYPAKIFMGDAGSNLLGYLIGLAAVIGSIKTEAVVSWRYHCWYWPFRSWTPASSSPNASSTGASPGRPTTTTSTIGWQPSASASGARSPTCTPGP